MTTRLRLSLLFAVILAAAGWCWARYPTWFVAALDVPYPLPSVHRAYLELLTGMPRLLLFAAAVLAALAAATVLERRHPPMVPAWPAIPVWGEAALYVVLLAVGALLSWRHFLYWGQPRWDHYWQFGEVLHYAMLRPDPATLAEVRGFCLQYPHSPSPLTPLLVAIGLFFTRNSLRLLQIYSLAATAGTVLLMRAVARRLHPVLVFWPLGFLFLTNAATVRNTYFIQLDAINGLVVMAFFWLWLRWREQPSARRLAAMVAVLIVGVFQKTSLFPLLAIPTLIAVYEAARDRRLAVGRLLSIVFGTALLPLLPFVGYLTLIGLTGNFQTQVTLMGTGWNELDYSWTRFLYATGFLLGPYLPLIARHGRWREPTQLALALFVVLFFGSIVVVRGPFWGRYYSHVIGACILLAAPAWGVDTGRWLAPRVYLVGVAALQWLIVYWQMI